MWLDRLDQRQKGIVGYARAYVQQHRQKKVGKAKGHSYYFLINDLAFMLDETTRESVGSPDSHYTGNKQSAKVTEPAEGSPKEICD